MVTIAVSMSKGGTGKTTVVRELGYQLAKRHRVLMIDLDPQGTLSNSVTLPHTPTATIADVLNKTTSISKAIIPITERLSIITSNRQLIEVGNRLSEKAAGAFALKKALEGIQDQFDYVITDSVGKRDALVINVLVAADALIIPIQPQGTDLKEIMPFLELVKDVNDLPSVNLSHIAILPTLYDQRYTHHQEATVTLGDMGYKMLSPIGRSIKVSEAMLQRVPLEEWDKNNPRVNEFATVAKEVIQWLKANQ